MLSINSTQTHTCTQHMTLARPLASSRPCMPWAARQPAALAAAPPPTCGRHDGPAGEDRLKLRHERIPIRGVALSIAQVTCVWVCM